MFDLLIFDLDGTLVDSLRDIAASTNFALESLGKQSLSLEDVRANLGLGLEHLLVKSFNVDLDSPVVRKGAALYHEHYMQNCLKTTRCYVGVEDFLQSTPRIRKAVLTSKAQAYTAAILAGLGISRHFNLVLGGDKVPERKPSPAGVKTILGHVGARAENTAIVGDSTYDIIAGRQAGITTVAALYGYQTAETLREETPDLEIRAFTELQKALRIQA